MFSLMKIEAISFLRAQKGLLNRVLRYERRGYRNIGKGEKECRKNVDSFP